MDIEKTIKELSINERKVLLTLSGLNGESSPDEILKKGNFNQEVEVMNAASWLQLKKLVIVEEIVKTVYILTKEGKIFLKNGLPEKRALRKILSLNGKASLKDLSDELQKYEIPVAIGWLKRNKWADIKKENNETILIATETGKKIVNSKTEDEKILNYINENPNCELDKEKHRNILSRKEVIKEKEIIYGTIKLTENGFKIIDHGIVIEDEISQITTKIIKDGAWKTKNIRPYDVNAFAPSKFGGKPHPLNELICEIRQIFLEMGFKEISGNYVESCFWNMDVLFIPQDHPAREMHDTIYCKTPSEIKIDDKEFLEKISDVHENGGITTSDGWNYKFSKKECNRALLRTHTTVNTIRYLYEHPKPPAKIFSLGQVFRKENIDSTHLPVFYQIEGIVHEENASFRQLIGLLAEFYKRMGFEKIRFRPGYFPYTEPSMEVEVYWNDKWMELGGSGIFRPEVTEPVGIKTPVLAWGLGLERLAMLRFGLNDMRDLYQSDFNWLNNQSML
jgi:phenylalanyl-tRNA synthetase alpha chain